MMCTLAIPDFYFATCDFLSVGSKPLPLCVVQFANICPCVEAECLPRLVMRKVAMLCAFTVGF